MVDGENVEVVTARLAMTGPSAQLRSTETSRQVLADHEAPVRENGPKAIRSGASGGRERKRSNRLGREHRGGHCSRSRDGSLLTLCHGETVAQMPKLYSHRECAEGGT